MSRFTKPVFGNVGRLGSPINRVRNLQRRLNKQARERADLSEDDTEKAFGPAGRDKRDAA